MSLRRAVLLVAGVLLVLGGALALAYPAVAATTCPRCYGLTHVTGNLHVERGRPAADRDRMTAVLAEADRRVTVFYGGRASHPRVLACFTAACYDRIGGGGERGMAVGNRAVMLSPRGLDPVIVAHELSHVELHRRLGGRAVPQWFDEGLAVVVADDPRYLRPAPAADRCRASSPDPLPATLTQWLTAASADEQVYAKAACRVSRWLGAAGGAAAVADLVDRLDRGESFAAVVG